MNTCKYNLYSYKYLNSKVRQEYTRLKAGEEWREDYVLMRP